MAAVILAGRDGGDVLAGLDEIGWAGLSHAYGPAGDVPGLLRALAAGSPADREHALHALYGTIFHQGSRHEATAPAVPFLAGLAAGGCTVSCVGLPAGSGWPQKCGWSQKLRHGAVSHPSIMLESRCRQRACRGLRAASLTVIPASPAIGGDHSGGHSGLCGGLADRAGGREEVFNQRRLAGFGDGQADLVGCQLRDGHVADVRA